MSVPCRHPECRKPLVFLVGRKSMVPVEAALLDKPVLKRVEAGERVPFDPLVHRAHFADCPGAKGFRKSKSKTPSVPPADSGPRQG